VCPGHSDLSSYGNAAALDRSVSSRLCLLDVSKSETDASTRGRAEQEGAQTIITAANGGRQCQIQLVSFYLDGIGVPVDPVKAGTWALIITPTARALSSICRHFARVAGAVGQRFDPTGLRAEAQSRANS
jgi:hypothetical protein